MFGFGFALVPFYEKICEVTGLRNIAQADEVANTQVDKSREVRIEFDSNVRKLPWTFRPLQPIVAVHPGEVRQAMYEIVNTTDRALTGQAIPSYGPPQAAQYFQKLECFCFAKQTLQPGERRQMPVVFVVDRGAAEGRRDDHAVVHVLRSRRRRRQRMTMQRRARRSGWRRSREEQARQRGVTDERSTIRRQAVLLRTAALALADHRLVRAAPHGLGRGVLVQPLRRRARGWCWPASACCSSCCSAGSAR